MPILTAVEAKSVRGRLLHVLIVVVLLLGGATLVYPFAVMISGSVRSEMDESDLDLVPDYLTDDATLYRKFLETKYNQRIVDLGAAHQQDVFEFRLASMPGERLDAVDTRALTGFLQQPELPVHWQSLGGIAGVRTVPENLRTLRQRLRERFDGNLATYTNASGTPVSSWLSITIEPPDWTSLQYEPPQGPLWEEYLELLTEAEPAQRQIVSLSGDFLKTVVWPRFGRDIEAANQAMNTSFASFAGFRLPDTLPGEEHAGLRSLWVEYVREQLHPAFVGVQSIVDTEYPRYLAKRYDGSISDLNAIWGSVYTSFDQIGLPQGRWLSGQERLDYKSFLAGLPDENLCLLGPEQAWEEWWLRHSERVVVGRPAPQLCVVMASLEYQHVINHRRLIKSRFVKRNFINVFDELVLEGRALSNTLVVCVLAVVLALLINPLAAYSMSRFRLPGTYKILLILMATMAFPPVVTLIPQFILLRQLDLINSFVALLLPLAVNGYLVFLLKGFFDSLPHELYEAATIDGAGEVRMFFQITMALSQPILAVVALTAFTNAYTMFLYALLVAPDSDMWLISVWLYQFQQRSGSGGIYASVLIASVPTLLIFLMVQRTIMRGIVVPTEK